MVSPNKVCALCGKGYKKSLKRSHSMRASIVRLQPNLQWFRLPASPTSQGGPTGQRIKLCTKCIKAIAKGKLRTPEKV